MDNYYLPITSWAVEDRPREKLLEKGRSSLSEAELIAILIGSGTKKLSAVDLAKVILKEVGNDLNALARLSIQDLQRFNGIGEAKAISIVAALEIGRRRKESSSEKRKKISCSADVYEVLKPKLWDLQHEEFWTLLLNRSLQVIKLIQISSGGTSGTHVDPKLIFKPALESLVSAVIISHNHPSGTLRPSQADVVLTKRLTQAGKVLDIPVLDHLIFTDNGFYSFKDEGTMPEVQ